jgi:hypothetical protein
LIFSLLPYVRADVARNCTGWRRKLPEFARHSGISDTEIRSWLWPPRAFASQKQLIVSFANALYVFYRDLEVIAGWLMPRIGIAASDRPFRHGFTLEIGQLRPIDSSRVGCVSW